MMNYKFHKNGSYNIHTIKTEKYKNVRMEIVFHNNFIKESIDKRKILFSILTQVSNNYPTRRDMLIKCEELYDTYIYSYSNRVGGRILNKICIDFLNPKYVSDDSYLEEVISFPFDLIFNPKFIDNTFPKDILDSEKNALKSSIENIKYSSTNYAIKEALKHTSENALFSYYSTVSDVDKITEADILETYEYVLKHDYIDIFIIGDVDFNNIIDLVNKYAKWNTIKSHEILSTKKLKPRNKIKKIKEKGEFLETKLVYVLSVGDLNDFDTQYTMNLYDTIMGGGGLDSLLSKSLREDNSLVYGVSSYYQKLDGLIIIETSLNKKDVKLAKKLIENVLINLKKKLIDEDILENAKTTILSGIDIRNDELEYNLEEYLMQYLNVLESINTRKLKYMGVTVNDIKRVANKVKINTIYELEDGEI